MRRVCRRLPLLGLYIITACAPLERSAQIARDADWQASTLQAAGMHMRSYQQFTEEARSELLHVYLGGDGRPWLGGRYPARDPSGSNPLVLDLMRLDPGPAVYLGRPCYHGLAEHDYCEPALWTMGRYSEPIIDAMRHAIGQLLSRLQPRAVVLVGYSGGGVLALAIAEQLALPVYVVTLGGNLDVKAWTDYHGYLPLDGSRDPSRSPARYASIPQLHLQGAQDSVVPPATTLRYTAALPETAVLLLPEADHRCCWSVPWKRLLRDRPWSRSLQGERLEPAHRSSVN